MAFLLRLSSWIDTVTAWIGKAMGWLVLTAVLISAMNAIVRKAFNIGSNSLLEIQWYLFSAIFLLAAGYTLMRNEHVRIDVLTSRLTPRAQAWVDIIGLLLFLMPVSLLMVYLSWPQFINAWDSGEASSNAGGLIRWPVKLLIPIGFALLIVQAASELIKRFAFLRGVVAHPISTQQTRSAEEELAEAIKAAAGLAKTPEVQAPKAH